VSAGLDISYSAVASFEKSKEGRAGRASSFFMAVLLAVFFIALLSGLIVGVSMYRYAAQTQMDTDKIRMSTGLLASHIKTNDRENVLGVGQGPEGKSLVLTEPADHGAYETRIYKYEGKIVQEYSLAGSAYTPQRAQVLEESDSFDFQVDGKLLTVTTDGGSVSVALRSAHGGA
jgi:hypothetical protein